MPGVRDLEARLLMDTRAGDRALHGFNEQCVQVLFELFGISRADTFFQYSDEYRKGALDEGDQTQEEDRADEHEEAFRAEDLKSDEDRVEYLRSLGWDVTNDFRQPLLITRHVCRVIEAVAKGIAGEAPEAEVVDSAQWADALRRDAQQFQRKRQRQ